MPTTARSRRSASHRKGDAAERAILGTAERLLDSAPLGEVSVEAIARGAGISRSSFYFYFASKEDVLLALVDRAIGWLEERVTAAAATVADDPQRGIEDGIAATALLWREHEGVLRAAIATAETDDRVRAAWDATLQRFVDVNAAMIRAERARGGAAGTASPEELATALVLLSERAFHAAAAGGDVALPADRIVPVLTEVWRRAIFGGG
jgi:TetR/AcrR family transcriptional regulator, ethionamide resistance regulator